MTESTPLLGSFSNVSDVDLAARIELAYSDRDGAELYDRQTLVEEAALRFMDVQSLEVGGCTFASRSFVNSGATIDYVSVLPKDLKVGLLSRVRWLPMQSDLPMDSWVEITNVSRSGDGTVDVVWTRTNSAEVVCNAWYDLDDSLGIYLVRITPAETDEILIKE